MKLPQPTSWSKRDLTPLIRLLLPALLSGCVVVQRPERQSRPSLLGEDPAEAVDASERARGFFPEPVDAPPEEGIQPALVESLPPPAVAEMKDPEPIPAIPLDRFRARVLFAHRERKIVVLEGRGQVPPGMTAVVLREGQAVGQIRLRGPRKGDRLTADLMAGDVRIGDEVRF